MAVSKGKALAIALALNTDSALRRDIAGATAGSQVAAKIKEHFGVPDSDLASIDTDELVADGQLDTSADAVKRAFSIPLYSEYGGGPCPSLAEQSEISTALENVQFS